MQWKQFKIWLKESILLYRKKSETRTAEIEFGLKFNGDLDVVIAKAGVEASITVTLGWGLKQEKL